MNRDRHLVLLVTGVLVALLAITFVALRWDSADRVATAVSALAGVAGVGVAVWAARSGGRARARARATGRATAAAGGYATSGIDAATGDAAALEVSRTGDAEASGGGQAISGIRRRDR
ncbi:hypothetical protein AB0I37_15520 [Micromonospora purpureochromogenes]|uniref:hypothetical protein n=1 Tax=Micromonospora purpureochromogenes TaxID=47872 RepID=UPI0034086C47